MITEWFIAIGQAIADWFLGLFGDDAPPAWLGQVADFISDLVARADGLGAWVPWPLFGTIAGFLVLLWLVFWVVKGIRWVWGLTPLSGGS